VGLAICVFCSSSDGVRAPYREAAEELGRELAGRGHTLVYGGASVGLMGVLARAVHRRGGRVIGVLPEPLMVKEIAYTAADELVVTRDLRERKAVMEARSDAFLALPGGFGTLEEMIELLTLKQLDLHRKALAWVNTAGFFDPLLAMFERLFEEGFAKPAYAGLYHTAPSATAALDYCEGYRWHDTGAKWW
jgi:hypothetical protein